MKTAGVKELKNRLSEYLRDVRHGETVLVTDRGEVVAQLVPFGGEVDQGSADERVRRRLIASGWVHPPTAEAEEPFPEPTLEGVPDFDGLWSDARKDRL
jgi:prevent-host-death family protein